MLKKRIIALLLLSILFGCYHYTPRSSYTTQSITDPRERISTERFSFLPPSESGWEMLTYYRGDVTLKMNKADRSVSIKIDPFSISPEKSEFMKKVSTREINKFINKTHFNKFTRMTVGNVSINNISCTRYDSVQQYPMQGIVLDGYTEFRCLDPKDTEQGPMITFSMSQNIRNKGLELWDGSKMITDIIKSIQFIPLDKETSLGYQHYLKSKDKWKEKRCFKLNGKKRCSQPDIATGTTKSMDQ